MSKPIILHIPDYYDSQIVEGNRLLWSKTTPLLKAESSQAQIIASIETVESYQCRVSELSEEYRAIATKCFHRDHEKGWELPSLVSDCKVFAYNWEGQDYHFSIYWIVISEECMLQIVGLFEPQFSSFYKRNFTICAQTAEIDTSFNFRFKNLPSELFESKQMAISKDELQEIIDFEKWKEEKAKLTEVNLNVSKPDFYDTLEHKLSEAQEVLVDAFMCVDWNVYYDLHNPENFSDPDSTEEWEDNSDVYQYFEEPMDNSKLTITSEGSSVSLKALENLISNHEVAEQKLLVFFEHYTFGNGGAYADAIHYQYAKIEIGRLHQTTFTNQEFLKRNLSLSYIRILEDDAGLELHFHCGWDAEHGISVVLDENFKCRIAE